MKPARFLKSLRYQVECHPAVHHPILTWLADDASDRGEFLAMGFQHFALVDSFPSYLEQLLPRVTESAARRYIAQILLDGYGEGSCGRDHVELYRELLSHLGGQPGEELDLPLHSHVVEFVERHRRLVRDEHFLVALGALGPGHEWALPTMFEGIVHGLGRLDLEDEEFEFFLLNQEQDVVHGMWLEEMLASILETDADMEYLEAGALLSLEYRFKFWDAVQARIAAWKRGEIIPASPRGEAVTLGRLRG